MSEATEVTIADLVGVHFPKDECCDCPHVAKYDCEWCSLIEVLQIHMNSAIRAAERAAVERCAKVCDDKQQDYECDMEGADWEELIKAESAAHACRQLATTIRETCRE